MRESLIEAVKNGQVQQPNDQLAACLEGLGGNIMETKEMASMVMDLIAVNSKLSSENNRIASEDKDQLTQIGRLQRDLSHKQGEMKSLQLQALDRVTLIQSSVEALLTKTYGLHDAAFLISMATNLTSLALGTGPLGGDNNFAFKAYCAIAEHWTYPVDFKDWNLTITQPPRVSNQSVATLKCMEHLLKIHCENADPELHADELGEATVDTIAKATRMEPSASLSCINIAHMAYLGISEVAMTLERMFLLFKSADFSRLGYLGMWRKGFNSAKVGVILDGLRHTTRLDTLCLKGANITEEQSRRMKAKGVNLTM
ncbi:hypothetical protein BGX34_003251 [Mortierella sp. NVP85]|nr:hypothetical protein BGX34_003251 [Mortierella sp. NVP85]